MSVIFYEDSDVKPGLPILPHLFDKQLQELPAIGIYACSFCGNVENLPAGPAVCDRCNREKWVEAVTGRRVG